MNGKFKVESENIYTYIQTTFFLNAALEHVWDQGAGGAVERGHQHCGGETKHHPHYFWKLFLQQYRHVLNYSFRLFSWTFSSWSALLVKVFNSVVWDLLLLVLVSVLPHVNMDYDDFFGLQALLHRDREPRIDRLRADPRMSMSDPEFIRHYRFRYNFVSWF